MRGHGKAAAASTSVMTSRFRLRNHGRTRKKRDPVEFNFHDFDFLCVVVLNSLSLGLTKAARHTKRFAGDPRGVGRSEKDRNGSNVLGLADATERRLRFNAFAK